MWRWKYFIVVIAFVVVGARAGAEFSIPWWTVDGGGDMWATDAFAEYELCATIGQPDAGVVMAGGGWELTGGFWPGATLSGPTIRPGDLNCDGTVGFGDINPFVLYLSNFAAWQATYSDCPPENGDINGDGSYPSFGDINPFVTLLSGGG
jgi:hypothetical protein